MSYNLYRKDKTEYTLIIDNSMLEKRSDKGPIVTGKLKIVCFKRNKDNKRTNLAEFYEDYRSFRVILDVLKSKWKSQDNTKISRFGGTDGKRRLTYELDTKIIGKGPVTKLVFWFEDLISKEKYEGYTGKMLFSITDPLDFMELFNLKDTLNNWELLNLKELWKSDDTEETTTS